MLGGDEIGNCVSDAAARYAPWFENPERRVRDNAPYHGTSA
jgi:hypothetical protein